MFSKELPRKVIGEGFAGWRRGGRSEYRWRRGLHAHNDRRAVESTVGMLVVRECTDIVELLAVHDALVRERDTLLWQLVELREHSRRPVRARAVGARDRF